MKRILLLLMPVLLFSTVNTVLASDGFYTNALEEGRTLFREALYKDALERLEFAAFGLLNNAELMRQVRGYTALSLFQLGRFDEAQNELETFKKNPHDLEPTEAGIDAVDTALFRVMIRTLYPEKDSGANTGTRRSFELKFQDIFKAAQREDWPLVEEGIARLVNLIPDDPRIGMLKGMANFSQGRFKEAFRELTSVRDGVQAEFRDRLLFFLARSSERVEEYGQARRAYKDIKDEQIRQSLEPDMRAVLERHKRDVAALARNFDRSLMRKLVDQFPGDASLALDIWTEASDNQTLANTEMESLAMELARFDGAVNREFFLQVSAWLESLQRESQALALIEKSGFAKDFSKENVGLLYQLGRLQAIAGKTARARDLMRRILTIQPQHEAARNFLESVRVSSNEK